MKTAIVILNWNGASMLKKFLPSVIKHSNADSEIIVADNASTDDSLTILSNNFPNIRTIVLSENWGFAEGYNKALEQVDAEYYVLLNSDVEVTDNWLQPIIQFMDNNKNVAACQPKMLSFTNKQQFEYAGAAGGFIDRYGYPFCRGRLFHNVEEDKGQYDEICPIFWASGACLVIRSELYKRAGGLDKRFFAHNEEIDLCWRLRLMGYEIYCIPQSIVYHLGGGTLPVGSPRKTFLNFRNNLTMLYKNLPDEELHHVLRVRCVLDIVAALQSLFLQRDFKTYKAILKARKEFNKWKKDFENDRQNIKKTTKNKQIIERKNYSILWNFYIKRISKYCNLP